MCLVVIAFEAHPELPLVIVANRDEFHARPAEAMHWWPGEPGTLGGRDLEAGGTWLALSRSGRYAGVTNVRDTAAARPDVRSRGELVSNFVQGNRSAQEFAASVDASAYRGFNLFAGAGSDLVYMSNRGAPPRPLPPGVYGLSNALLDTPWPKLVRARERVRQIVAAGAAPLDDLFAILADRTPAPDAPRPDEIAEPALARAASAPFIVHPRYGTRCSTVLVRRRDGSVTVSERRFDAAGRPAGDSSFSLDWESGASQARPADGR